MSALSAATSGVAEPGPEHLTDPGVTEPPASGTVEPSFNNPTGLSAASNDYFTAPVTAERSTDFTPSPDHPAMAPDTTETSYDYSAAVGVSETSHDCPTSALGTAERSPDFSTAPGAIESNSDHLPRASVTAKPIFNNTMDLSTVELSNDYLMTNSSTTDAETSPDCQAAPMLSEIAAKRNSNYQLASSASESNHNYLRTALLSRREPSFDIPTAPGTTETNVDDYPTGPETIDQGFDCPTAQGTAESSFDSQMASGAAEADPDSLEAPGATEPSYDSKMTTLGTAEPSINCHTASSSVEPGPDCQAISQDSGTNNLAASDAVDLMPFPVIIKTEPEEDSEVIETSVGVERIKSDPEQLLYRDHEIKEEIVIGPTGICEPYTKPAGPSSNKHIFELHSYGVGVQNVDELQCGQCGEWSISAAALQRHKQTHGQVSESQGQVGHSQGVSESTNFIYQCQQCNKVCKSNWHLHKHLKTHSRVNEELQNSQNNVIRIDKRSKKPYRCNVCKKRFTHKCNLGNHMKSHDKNTLNQCTQCGKNNWSHWHLITHLRTHHPRVIAAKVQPFAKIQRQKQTKVNKINKLLKPYQCDICEKKFKNKGNLSVHLKIHTLDADKSTKYQCEKCGKKCISKWHLIKHEVMHTRLSGVKMKTIVYQCKLCSKKCLSEWHLVKHEATHCEINPITEKYHCDRDQCDKPFPTITKLWLHQITHIGIKRNKCNICQKEFKLKNSWHKHVKMHRLEAGKVNDSNEISCLETNSDSDTAANRNNSDIKETDNRISNPTETNETNAYQCMQSTDKFTSEMLLVDHQVTHEKNPTIAQFNCDQCDKQFQNRTRLSIHKATHSEIRQFKCNICETKFKYRFSLNRHLRLHIDIEKNNDSTDIPKESLTDIPEGLKTKEYECNLCSVKFKSDWYLAKHKAIHEKNPKAIETKEYQCNVCTKSFMSKWHLVKHQTSHSRVKNYPCDLCEKHYLSVSSLFRHHAINHGEIGVTKFTCDICHKDFNNKYFLIEHLKRHKKAQASTLEAEKVDGLELKLYPCDQCNKQFRAATTRSRHRRQKHSEIKIFACDICQCTFKYKDTLIRHSKKHSLNTHKLKERKEDDPTVDPKCVRNPITQMYHCHQCNNKFPSRQGLTIHQITHSEIRRFTCDICKDRFKYKFSLERHLKSHSLAGDTVDDFADIKRGKETGETPEANKNKKYKCNQCSRQFISNRQLVRHQASHLPLPTAGLQRHKREKVVKMNKLYPCGQCNKRFTYSTGRSRHRRVEHPEILITLFTCDICKTEFRYKDNLIKHLKRHSQEDKEVHDAILQQPDCEKNSVTQLYSCDLCNKKFTFRSRLYYHRLIHSEIRRFTCNICKRGYNHKYNLNKHLKSHRLEAGKEKEVTHNIHNTEEHIEEKDDQKGDPTFRPKWQRNEITKMFHCDKCDRQFPNRQKMKIHQASHSKIRRFKCHICKNKFKYKLSLKRHLKRHSLVADESVDLADMQPETDTGETSEAIVKQEYECNECNRQFLSNWHLNKHKSSHLTDPASHLTDTASHLTDTALQRSKRGLKKVVKMGIPVSKPYPCNICEKGFTNRSNLSRHLRNHSKPGTKYQCNVCSRQFISNWHLVKHQAHRCRPTVASVHRHKLYACNQCNRKFPFESALLSHQITHRYIQPFNCNICETKFKHKSALVRHRKRHDSEVRKENLPETETYQKVDKEAKVNKIYPCDQCSKRFRDATARSRHFRLKHNEIEPITCDVCDKKFKYKETLLEHLKNHNLETQIITSMYHCGQCPKKFSCKSKLTRHQIIHSEMWRFTCDICARGFNHKCNLLTHLKTHLITRNIVDSKRDKTTGLIEPKSGESELYQIMEHKCEQCNKICTTNWHLLKHQKTHFVKTKDDSGLTERDEDTDYQSPPPRKEHKCVQCNKICKTNWHLLKHQKTHLAETKDDEIDLTKSDEDEEMECQRPPASPLRSSPPLRKQYKCEECNKTCKTNWHLLKHQRTHLVESKDKGTLAEDKKDNAVIEIESDEDGETHPESSRTQYKCSQCNKTCSSNWHLVKHQSTHTGLQLFKCGICDERLKGKINFEKHLKNHSLQFQKLNKSIL